MKNLTTKNKIIFSAAFITMWAFCTWLTLWSGDILTHLFRLGSM